MATKKRKRKKRKWTEKIAKRKQRAQDPQGMTRDLSDGKGKNKTKSAVGDSESAPVTKSIFIC